ncbi:MAG: hypothetical protein LUE24_08990 [Lachnospiraceae bacterium]|nr:hypothetical protein [Lachnospiraceae bacterium]
MNRLIYCVLSSKFGAYLELRILMWQTAKVFNTEVPKAGGRSASELLKAYAQFTAEEATRAIQNGDNLETLHQKLYQMAYTLGNRLRRWLRPKDEKDCFGIIILLYRNIGIQMEEESSGTICVCKCYFSDFYTPEVCSIISAIDQGIFAGIYQSGKLAFRERITDGCDVCRADFR